MRVAILIGSIVIAKALRPKEEDILVLISYIVLLAIFTYFDWLSEK